MELRDYLRILWSRKVLIALCGVLGIGSALALSARIAPTYAASAKVFVGPRAIEKDDAAGALQELTLSQQFVSSYAEILKSRPLAEVVVRKTNSSISPEVLTKRIDTRVIPDTRLIEVTVSGPSPAVAAQYANELVNSFVENQENRFGGGALVTASVLEPALEPTAPVSPKPLQNGIVAGLLGLMLGTGVAFVLEQLDSTLKTKEDVERTFDPVPAIATIPLAPNNKDWNIFLQSAPNSPESEAIRILRTNIQFFSVDQPVQRVLITSTFAGEGKTTVAVNLAASIAATNLHVLLIEADLRRPALKNYFPDFHGAGLSEVLCGQANLEDAVWSTDIPNLSVVLSGYPPPNPSELLGSDRMAELLDVASTIADIILDTPPALPVTDATALAPQSDGVILVVRAGETSAQKALDVTRNFERNGVRVLGVALNALGGDTTSNYYYHYGSIAARDGGRAAKKRAAKFDDYVVSNAPSAKTRPRQPANATRSPRKPRPPEDSPPLRRPPDKGSVEVRTRPLGGSGSPVKVRVQSPVGAQEPEPRPARAQKEADYEGTEELNERDAAAFKARLRAAVGQPKDKGRPNGRAS